VKDHLHIFHITSNFKTRPLSVLRKRTACSLRFLHKLATPLARHGRYLKTSPENSWTLFIWVME